MVGTPPARLGFRACAPSSACFWCSRHCPPPRRRSRRASPRARSRPASIPGPTAPRRCARRSSTGRGLCGLAVRLDPEKKLARDESVAALVEAARAEVAGARRASLEVEVRPAGARIFVDGDPRGTRAELPTGKHLLRVERSGFYP